MGASDVGPQQPVDLSCAPSVPCCGSAGYFKRFHERTRSTVTKTRAPDSVLLNGVEEDSEEGLHRVGAQRMHECVGGSSVVEHVTHKGSGGGLALAADSCSRDFSTAGATT